MTAPQQAEQPQQPELDWAGAFAQGVAGGIANGTAVGAIGTALRDLAVQEMAYRAAAQLKAAAQLQAAAENRVAAENAAAAENERDAS